MLRSGEVILAVSVLFAGVIGWPQGYGGWQQPEPEGNSVTPSSQNLWWQGQNAFQQPQGHPGVKPLGSGSNIGSGWESPKPQQPTSAQYQNTPKPQQQFTSPPQTQNQNGLGWNSQQQSPQQFQPQGQGFGQPDAVPAGCDLVNKADCHKPSSAATSLPNYYEPEPYPGQVSNLQPPPEQNLNYNPFPSNPNPPPQPIQPVYQPQPSPKPAVYPQHQPQRPSFPVSKPTPQQIHKQPGPQRNPLPYPGCPAAMLCVQDEYCNAIGIAEQNPVRMSEADRINRVALMECSEPMTGVVGVCCRDPTYRDPWANMNMNGPPKKGNHHHHHHAAPNKPPQGNHLTSGGGGTSSGSTGGAGNNYGWSQQG